MSAASSSVIPNQRQRTALFSKFAGLGSFDQFRPHPFNKWLPGVWVKRVLAPSSAFTAGGGKVSRFNISPELCPFIGDISFETTLGAAGSGTYSSYPGINSVTDVLIKSGANNISDTYKYRQAMAHILSIAPLDVIDLILAAAGGSLPSAATVCYGPLPLPWSSFKHSDTDEMYAFPLCCTQSGLQIELTAETLANLYASGGSSGSFTNLQLVYWEYVADTQTVQMVQKQLSELDSNGNIKSLGSKFVYKGVDYKSPVDKSSVTTATSTAIDMTGQMPGDCFMIIVSLFLASDWTTAHNYYLEKTAANISALTLTVGQDSLYSADSSNEIANDQLAGNACRNGTHATLGRPIKLVFGGSCDPHDWTGSVPLTSKTTFKLQLTHDLGADGYVNVTGVNNAIYRIQNGAFVRDVGGDSSN